MEFTLGQWGLAIICADKDRILGLSSDDILGLISGVAGCESLPFRAMGGFLDQGDYVKKYYHELIVTETTEYALRVGHPKDVL
jgi:hypothetical protein